MSHDPLPSPIPSLPLGVLLRASLRSLVDLGCPANRVPSLRSSALRRAIVVASVAARTELHQPAAAAAQEEPVAHAVLSSTSATVVAGFAASTLGPGGAGYGKFSPQGRVLGVAPTSHHRANRQIRALFNRVTVHGFRGPSAKARALHHRGIGSRCRVPLQDLGTRLRAHGLERWCLFAIEETPQGSFQETKYRLFL